ncbi:MAG: glycine--tRNA ligase, partial [Planctomycetes bacterium]|nr:glycine--tRNA ligase [Planctomycetota bacterium]
MAAEPNLMERLTALCKRRGFIFPGSEIYGGLGGFWDYGPLGVEVKRHIKDLWWRDMVLNPPAGPDGKEVSMVGIDAALIMNPKVWEASGHVGGFSDPMVDDKETKERFRADQLSILVVAAESQRDDDLAKAAEADGQIPPSYEIVASFLDSKQTVAFDAVRNGKIAGYKVHPESDVRFAMRAGVSYVNASLGLLDKKNRPFRGYVLDVSADHYRRYLSDIPSPFTGNKGTLTEPREFNLMFETYVGAVQTAASKAYLRPETAQGIFVNFPNVLDTMRVKIPFGIGQVGKAFRNEINPRNYTFRSREFEQMEIEFFCHPDSAMDWYEFWRKVRYDWYVNLGLKSEKLRLRDQTEDELAHYSKVCADIEYLFPFSDEFQELEGVAHRGNYDL